MSDERTTNKYKSTTPQLKVFEHDYEVGKKDYFFNLIDANADEKDVNITSKEFSRRNKLKSLRVQCNLLINGL